MRYKAVLFDMDGVIVDSEPLHMLAFQQVLAAIGYELTEDGYIEYFIGKTDRKGLEEFFGSLNLEADIDQLIEEKSKVYLDLVATKLAPYSGVVELIKDLAGRVRLALVTGSLRTEADAVLEACGMAECFDVTVTADDVANGKPDPEGYLKAASALGVSIKDCVIVEDSPSGVSAAVSAGIDCIAVTNTHTEDELSLANKVVKSLSQDSFTM